jgi:hypothetical protein
MNNGVIRKLLLLLSFLINIKFFTDAADILEIRAVDGTDQQEYFVHYHNCMLRFIYLLTIIIYFS